MRVAPGNNWRGWSWPRFSTRNVLELECSARGKKYDASIEQHLCTCGKPLLARYDLRRAATTLTLENLKTRPRTLWRYAEVLPNDPAVSLGEGMTALVHAERLGASIVCGQGGRAATVHLKTRA